LATWLALAFLTEAKPCRRRKMPLHAACTAGKTTAVHELRLSATILGMAPLLRAQLHAQISTAVANGLAGRWLPS
jgi:hypothetical protein